MPVGSSDGSGIALMHLRIAVIGTAGCCIFRGSRNMLSWIKNKNK
jgi:hypothetical protein